MTGYSHRQRIDLDNRGSNQTLSGCQYRILLSAATFVFANAKSDLSDLRFTGADQVTVLPYWIESLVPGVSAAVWVKLPAMTPARMGFVWIWYGNAAATGVSSYAGTMEFPAVAGDCTAVFSGVNTYAGLLDTYPETGSIKVHFTPLGAFTGKRIFSKFNTSAYADFIDLYVDSGAKLVLRICRAGVVTLISGTTVLQAGVEYSVCFAWNSFLGAGTFKGWKILYLNGNIEGKKSCQMPNNGSAAPFASGQLVTHDVADTAGSAFPGALADGCVFNTQKQRHHAAALHERRKFYESDEESKWVKGTKPIYRYAAGEQGIVYEPDVFFESGKYRIWHSTALVNTFVGYSESTDLVNWTNKQVVIGQGVGGEPGYAFRKQVTKFPGDAFWYCYYQNANVEGGPVRVAKSVDGLVWTDNVTALAPNLTFTPGYHSPGVFKIGGTYYMWMDTEQTAKYRYYTGVATATNPMGPFVMQRISYDFSMGPLKRPLGNPFPAILVDGALHLWGHGVPNETPDPTTGVLNLPSEGARMLTYNNGVTHVPAYSQHPLRIDAPYEFDQVSDLHVFYDGSNTWCASACNDNYTFNPTEFIAQIAFYRFAGTIEQLVRDLKHTIHAPQPAAAAQPKKVVTTGNKLIFQNGKPVTLTA